MYNLDLKFCFTGEKGDAGISGRDGSPGPQGEKGLNLIN